MNHKKKVVKCINIWKLNNISLNNYWVKEDTREEIKRLLEMNKIEELELY